MKQTTKSFSFKNLLNYFNKFATYFVAFFLSFYIINFLINNLFRSFISFCWKNSIIFNYPVTSNMEKIISLHHSIMWFILAIMFLVLWLILSFYMSYVYFAKDITFMDVSKNDYSFLDYIHFDRSIGAINRKKVKNLEKKINNNKSMTSSTFLQMLYNDSSEFTNKSVVETNVSLIKQRNGEYFNYGVDLNNNTFSLFNQLDITKFDQAAVLSFVNDIKLKNKVLFFNAFYRLHTLPYIFKFYKDVDNSHSYFRRIRTIRQLAFLSDDPYFDASKNYLLTKNIFSTVFSSETNSFTASDVNNFLKPFYSIVFSPLAFSRLKNKELNVNRKIEILRVLLTTKILANRKFVEQKYLESAWTLIPCYILINIAIPSFNILYLNEEIINPDLTVNIIAHQWYWSIDLKDLHFGFLMKNNTSSNFNLYENNLDSYIFDSYMEPEDYLDKMSGDFRLLETEEPFILPSNVNLRIIISSFDTLHSFTIPSIGLKVDAVPGRLNELGCLLKNSGVFYGQCSEICGIGHAFMPITLYSVPRLNFLLGTNVC